MTRLAVPAHHRIAVVVAVLATVIAGCGGSAATSAPASSAAPASVAPSPSATTPPTTAPTSADTGPTTGRIEVPEQGFAITLPDGWKRIPLDKTALDAFLAQLPPGSDLEKILSSQAGQLAAGGIRFWAMNLTPEAVAGGFAPNINVIVQPAAGVTLDALKTIAQGQLENVSAISNVRMADATLPAGEAVKATYSLNQATTSGTTIKVSGTQYYVVGPTNLYILSLSCGGTDPGACSADFDALIQSLSISG